MDNKLVAEMTREEIRADILEVVTTAVTQATKMLSEDIVAVNDSVIRLDRKFTKRFKNVDLELAKINTELARTNAKLDKSSTELSKTNTLITAHIDEPLAHSRPIPA